MARTTRNIKPVAKTNTNTRTRTAPVADQTPAVSKTQQVKVTRALTKLSAAHAAFEAAPTNTNLVKVKTLTEQLLELQGSILATAPAGNKVAAVVATVTKPDATDVAERRRAEAATRKFAKSFANEKVSTMRHSMNGVGFDAVFLSRLTWALTTVSLKDGKQMFKAALCRGPNGAGDRNTPELVAKSGKYVITAATQAALLKQVVAFERAEQRAEKIKAGLKLAEKNA